MSSLPQYLIHRAKMWDEISARNQAGTGGPITVTLPDGKKVAGIGGRTTPLEIAQSISAGLAQRVIVAKVNGSVWDLTRPLESDANLELLDFETKEGAHTFWHSSAHVLGQSLELLYPEAKLCIGPPIDDGGFYYDVHLGDKKITPEDFDKLMNFVKTIQAQKQPFTRLVLTKQEALDMFGDNPFKVEIISKRVPDGETLSTYRCGPLIDLCRGPHVVDTGKIKSFKITKNASAYWLGKAENPSLQRVYGISFPDNKKLKEWEHMIQEAEKRDHRRVGLDQKLFFFHALSPGSCFFLPHGTRIYNRLISFIRAEYHKRGYSEVISPNVYNVDLWKTSGHWANYQENMFSFVVEEQQFAMKPMNCPGHCLMFKSGLRSYRELPLRLADFGVLHRNEISGALSGLTRVRRFQQDDAHIFCRQDQIAAEVSGVLDMLQHVYGIFGFKFELQLSTRPDKFLGDLALWDKAEKALAECLEAFGQEWSINPADGAFYGPKIDIKLTDALNRKHQCATIQLDFQLPIRFDLTYKGEEDYERPVMIHRAILGSVERMIAVLIEHTAGKWPFWLSPRQCVVIPIGKFVEYAKQVTQAIHEAGFYVDLEDSNKQLPKKIREAQMAQYNWIVVVGAEEQEHGTVNLRNRDRPDDKEVIPLASLIDRFNRLNSELL